ncbi:MAG: helix-turn-helix transcriptional regulator [Rhodomicrobium sp.]|nr:helix-turn-helix transcriptional regulator [Rhodomicrobium sp.]
MDVNEAINALSALAQEHRLAIFRLLVKAGPDGLPAGEIGGRIGIGPTSASFHLKELDRAGLIDARREGRFIRYAFNAGAMRRLLTFLTEDCCQGRPELCGDLFSVNRCAPREELADE